MGDGELAKYLLYLIHGLALYDPNKIGLRYDSRVFNVDSIAECDQLNLTHETKTKNASAH